MFLNIINFTTQVFDTNFTELIIPGTKHLKGEMYQLFPPREDKVFNPPKDKIYLKWTKGQHAYLRKKLKIYPKYVSMAQETFRRVAKKLNQPAKKVTYIGMHHRQTGADLLEFKIYLRINQNSTHLTQSRLGAIPAILKS